MPRHLFIFYYPSNYPSSYASSYHYNAYPSNAHKTFLSGKDIKTRPHNDYSYNLIPFHISNIETIRFPLLG